MLVVIIILTNSQLNYLRYEEFLQLYKVPVTPKDFAIVMDAIPSGVALLFRNVLRPDPQNLPAASTPVDS